MRPIRLVISAFGPYKDRVEIDFAKLGENGIFLITGDTGSGKTTIFDAISFALFGEASGSKRETASFRSDFAIDEVDTFVELEFVHKNIIYKVERVPRYMRKKKRGEGLTSVGGDASLIYLDKVVTGEKNVTDECVKIMGMNASQFKQVSMIAQGEFLDLLLAKTKDRATIFRHIFDTGIYKGISDKLKERYLAKKREYEDIATYKKGYLGSVLLEGELSGDESTDEVLVLLDKEIVADTEKEKVLEEEKGNLSKEVSRLVGVISEGKLINESISNLEIARKKLRSLLEIKDDIDSKGIVIKKNKDIWDLVMPKYMELESTKKDLVDKKSNLEGKTKNYEVVLEDYEKSLESYKGIKVRQEEKNNYNRLIEEGKGKLSLLVEIDDLNKRLDYFRGQLFCLNLEDRRVLLSKIKEFKSREIEISTLREEIGKLKEEYVRDNRLYGEHYDLFLSAQAGILASDLREGEACPVCGSVSHPSLAVVVENVLSKEELDCEKEALEETYQIIEKKRLELLDKEKDLAIIRQEVVGVEEESLLDEINVLESKCVGIEIDDDVNAGEIEKFIQQIELEIKGKSRELDEWESEEVLNKIIEEYREKTLKIEKEISEIENNYDYLVKEKTRLETLIGVLKEDILRLEESVVKLDEEYRSCYRELGYDNEEDYMEVRLDKEELSRIELEVSEYRQEVLKVNSNISSLEKVINGREAFKLEEFEEQLSLLNRRLDEIGLSLKDINSKVVNNKKIYDSLVSVAEKTTKLEREVMIYKDLSDTANGSIAGKSKLEFEQYVQASYFDRVLLSANKRFSYMTEERYQLVRKEEASKVSDKLGLELEVMDYYTGKRRDVKSLSGGESFKAALSLALGMSDTIQEFSGGIVVEAMFIDEGFGSLDDESLDQAMNAIMMLSQGNKMIGIISHVNELKARIDKKIVVKKSSSGSSVSLVV